MGLVESTDCIMIAISFGTYFVTIKHLIIIIATDYTYLKEIKPNLLLFCLCSLFNLFLMFDNSTALL